MLSLRFRAWLWRFSLLLLLVFPSLLYHRGITMRFGLRDDYSILREAREEPETLREFCTSQGRPFYGPLLTATFARLDGIDSLHLPREGTAGLVGLLCASVAFLLDRQLGWRRPPAVLLAALLAVLPSVQVVVHWAICWPHVLAGVLGVASFALAEQGRRATARRWRWGLLGAGAGGLLLALLTYQSNALFYVVLAAAGFLSPAATRREERIRGLRTHLLLVGAMLVAAFLITEALFHVNGYWASPRVTVESAWLDKIGWFVRNPLANALALIVVAEDSGGTEPWHCLATAVVALLLVGAGALEWRRAGRAAALTWWAGLLVLGALAYAASFVAAERWPTYRTIFPLTGVVAVFAVRAVADLGARWPGVGERLAGLALAGLVAAGGWLARENSVRYLARMQAEELRRVEAAAGAIDPARASRIYVWLPDPEDSGAALQYCDEFGSQSADCDWCAKEMVLQILHLRFPQVRDLAARMTFLSGWRAPAPGTYDILLDLRLQR